jgi:hypothetical protein
MFERILERIIDVVRIARRFAAVRGVLGERSRWLVAAAESAAIKRGGVSAVSRATGMSRQVIRQGVAELNGRNRSMNRIRGQWQWGYLPVALPGFFS